MAFRTKIDFSDNRQVKQREATIQNLSGATSFGLTFSALTTGPNLTTSGVTETYGLVASTFSGNSGTTVYTWYDPRMQLAISTLSAITPSNSGITQHTGGVFTPSSTIVIDGNTINTTYSGVSFDISCVSMVDLGGGAYSGTSSTDSLKILSADTLASTERTIWVDVSGITRTERLIITRSPQIGYVWTCTDLEGMGEWSLNSTGNTINWYSENILPPSTIPIATGVGSIAMGNGAEALSSNMFVYGTYAGSGATGSNESNFIGLNAGNTATGSSESNFIGRNAGYQAGSSRYSNFIGYYAGIFATVCTESNFIGNSAGYQVSGASYSNFIGSEAGYQANNASNCTLIGHGVGKLFSGNNIGPNNIIIGTNISLPNGKANAINIGGVLFGTGTYSATTGTPHITGSTGGKIGILTADPTQELDVGGNARFRIIGGSASAGALHYTADGTLTTNTSDERLKTNISTLTNALDKVKVLRGVTYNWTENPDGDKRIGFIAQEVASVVPELTFINKNIPELYMGVHYDNVTALLVEAVKELSSGITTNSISYLETQTILAEDNNIDLNYSGTPETAIGGGVRVLHAKGIDQPAELLIDENGDWITNNDMKPKGLIIPYYTPTSTNDIIGNEGNITRDNNYLYIKTVSGWKRSNLESF